MRISSSFLFQILSQFLIQFLSQFLYQSSTNPLQSSPILSNPLP